MVDIVKKILNTALELRKYNISIGTSEIVSAINLVKSYSYILGKDPSELTDDELRFILESVFVKRDYIKPYFDKAWNNTNELSNNINADKLLNQIEKKLNMLKLNFGATFKSINTIIDKKKNRKQQKIIRDALSTLQRIGVIRKYKRGYRVVDKRKAHEIAESLARKGYDSIVKAGMDELVDKLIRRPHYLISKDVNVIVYGGLTEDHVKQMNTQQLLEIAYYAYKMGNKKLLQLVLKELSQRSNLDEYITEKHLEFLKRTSFLTSNNALSILKNKPRLLKSYYGSKELLTILKSQTRNFSENILDILNALPYIADELDAKDIERILSKVPLTKFHKIPRKLLRKIKDPKLVHDLNMALNASKAFEYLVKAYSTNTDIEANVEYAEYLLTKIINSRHYTSLGYSAKLFADRLMKILSSTRGESSLSAIVELLRGMDFMEAWDMLRSLYLTTSDQLLKMKIRTIASRLWMKQRGSIRSRILNNYVKSSNEYGRIDVRETILNIVRLKNNPIRYRSRVKLKDLNLVVDVSGSMYRYSTWVLLTASAFIKNVSRIVVFSEEPKVIDLKKNRTSMNTLIDYLLSMRFGGYTDIVSALMKAIENTSTRRIILISDLKQTVKTNIDIVELIKSLLVKGWSIAIIAPKSVNDVVYRRMIRDNIPVYVVENPLKTPMIFYQVWRSLK